MKDAADTWTPLARRLQSTAATLTSTPAEKPAASSSASCAHDVGATISAQRLRARDISAFSSSCGTSIAVAVGGGGGGVSATATCFVAVGGGASGCRGGGGSGSGRGGGGVMRREERATHGDVALHAEAFSAAAAAAALSALQRSQPWHCTALKGETQFSSL